jgi:hypothetical protein
MRSMQYKLTNNHTNPKDYALIVATWATFPGTVGMAAMAGSTIWTYIKEKTKSLLQTSNHALMLPKSKLKLTCCSLKRITHLLT